MHKSCFSCKEVFSFNKPVLNYWLSLLKVKLIQHEFLKRILSSAAPVIDGSGEVRVITVIVNETATLPCPARADPPPTREWTYEGRRVYRGYSSELRFTGTGTLEILTAQMSHAGTYRCMVTNLAGNDSITYLLKVLGKSFFWREKLLGHGTSLLFLSFNAFM